MGDVRVRSRLCIKDSVGGPAYGHPANLLATDGDVSQAVEWDSSIRSDVERRYAAADAVDAWPESVALDRWRPRRSGPTGSLDHCQER